MSPKRMAIASCKAKGRRLQQTVAEDVLRAFPALEADDVRSTPMGCAGEDVQMSPRAQRLVRRLEQRHQAGEGVDL